MKLERIGVTSAKEAQFAKKGIYSVEDLLQYLPRGYKDFSRETGLQPDEECSCFIFRLLNIRKSMGQKVPYVRATGFEIRTHRNVSITWFNQNYLADRFLPYVNRDFYVAGKVVFNPTYNNYTVNNPDLFEPVKKGVNRIYPVYSKVPGMSSEYLTGKINAAFSISVATAEKIPYEIVSRCGYLSEREALYHLHNPLNQEQIAEGQRRIIFDDLLYFAIHNEWAQNTAATKSTVRITPGEVVQKINDGLPYRLTVDQEKTVSGIIDLASSGERVNALVQGDVGCGKTIVALLVMAAAAASGYQSVLMAPTQVLARQHFDEISAMMAAYGIKTVYLGSEMKAKEKAKVSRMIREGEADIIIGTHSVISDSVEYHNLGLTVADEEHKFGVAQRAALVKKAAAGVHSITMSATPIPRTLAQVVYGSGIQLYTIRSMPAGRKPVMTGIATTKEKLFRFIAKEAKKGHQTYIVCPLIDSSDALDDVRSVEEVYKECCDILGPQGIQTAMLTGKNSKGETEDIIDRFRKNEYSVLVSTTVVEVGVNIPTATTMVVSNAERFGLASLHQLRGRVGRSALQAYCVLVEGKRTEKGRLRLDTMCRTTDGFQIAEADLSIRGAGDFLGTRQSGENKYITLVMGYPEVYDSARSIARELLASPNSCALVKQVQQERDAALSGAGNAA